MPRLAANTWSRARAWLAPPGSSGRCAVATRERWRQNLITTGLLVLAGGAYAVAYFQQGVHLLGLVTSASVAVGLASPLIAKRGAFLAAANLTSLALFAVVVLTTYTSGGLKESGHAWLYIVPLVAGLLGGMRALLLWSALTLAAVLAIATDGFGRLPVTNLLTEAMTAYHRLFDVVLLLTTFWLITSAFLRTRALAEAETAEALRELAEEAETRRRAEAEARQADQAKSAFLATMSHEIRTPMNGVLGLTDLLLEMELGDQQRGFAEVIKSSGESLMSILNDILDYSKIEAGRMEIESIDFDLRAVVEQSAQLMAGRAHEKRLDLIVDIDPLTPDLVVGDPARLRQVLTQRTASR